jgi:glycyl-tRNA synthetase beta chain
VSDTMDLLLEIGCEEIPSSFILPALDRMKSIFADFCERNRISHGEVKTFATPRRLVITAVSVAEAQSEKIEEIKGPPAKVALDENGKFTPAAAKFAESRGGAIENLTVKTTEKGDYVFIVKKEEGRKTEQILTELPARIIENIGFPKNMRWDVRRVTFARPVRWIMLLFGDKPIVVDYEKIPSGGFTYGNRYYGGEKIAIGSIAEYFEKLEAAGVMADHERRREALRESVLKIAGGKPHMTESLLTDVNFLVEYPYVAAGSFPVEFTELPKEVLIICIEKNQHYFPVEDPATGKMLPRFVVAMNVPLTENPTVLRGYEKVLISRLKDAKFFYDEDINKPLKDRVESLKKITFQEKLGSLLDKTNRVKALVRKLGEDCKLSEADIAVAERAAELMKADLTTHMVFEYTEIQGTVGKYYALKSGENPAVAQAIEEHYMPRFAEDELPASAAGALLALADKIDTIVGYFSVGLIPTGSADPYQLRRAALGITRILDSFKLAIKIDILIDKSIATFNFDETINIDDLKSRVDKFLYERFTTYLKSEGFAYDVINAVVEDTKLDGYGIFVVMKEAVTGIAGEYNNADFIDFVEFFKRVNNICSQAQKELHDRVVEGIGPEIDERLFDKDEENKLNMASDDIAKIIDDTSVSYIEILRSLYGFNEIGKKFFDSVMVMDENKDKRINKLLLLNSIRSMCRRLGDFSMIIKRKE